MVISLRQWVLPDHLTHYIMTQLFDQPHYDSNALVRGRLPDGEVLTWLYNGQNYQPISLESYAMFHKAAISRGGHYSMEICEFVIEEVLLNGDVVLNYWRRVRDDTGEGGRAILSYKEEHWVETQYLNSWERHP